LIADQRMIGEDGSKPNLLGGKAHYRWNLLY
jgi:hypothetical protein